MDAILKETPGQNKDYLKELCGLPITTYFSALKLRWLLDNVPEVQEVAERGDLLFGTVDSWLLWVSTEGFSLLLFFLVDKLIAYCNIVLPYVNSHLL